MKNSKSQPYEDWNQRVLLQTREPALCDISSGSALFVETKSIVRERNDFKKSKKNLDILYICYGSS